MSRSELRQQWEGRIAGFRSSGQSAPEWCATHGIKADQLRYWLRQFPTQTEGASSVRWMPVQVVEPDVDSSLTVHIGNARIEVQPGFNPELLKQIVQVLAHAE